MIQDKSRFSSRGAVDGTEHHDRVLCKVLPPHNMRYRGSA